MAAEPMPSHAEVQWALATLKPDGHDRIEEALDVLVREGSKASREAIADFGATCFDRRSSILAAQALLHGGVDVAMEHLDRLQRACRSRPEHLSRVATMLGAVPGSPSRRLLVKMARDQRDRVAIHAVRALGSRREEESRDALHVLLDSPHPTVQAAAAFALSRLRYAENTADLLFARVRSASEDGVGDACALALSRTDGAQEYANRALAVLIGNGSGTSFHPLVKLAIWGGDRPDPELVDRAALSSSEEVREVAYDLIGLTRLPGFQKRLLRATTSERNTRNAVAAWLALSRCGIEDVADGIAANIGKKGEPSYWAIQCAGRHPHPRVVRSLLDASLDTVDPVRRELAQRALRSQQPELAATRLTYVEIARKEPATARGRAALLGLGNLKDAESFHALVGLLEKEEDRGGQLAILAGLEKLTGHYYEPNPQVWREWFRMVDGQVSFEPKPVERKASRERIAKIQGRGISAETETAVEDGLLWLARHQEVTGAWDGVHYNRHCIPKDACAGTFCVDAPLAYTGLALLAFQGAGYSHVDGPYRDAVQQGIEYVLASQLYDGSDPKVPGWCGYQVPIACQALCDGFGLTRDPLLGHGAQRMVDYLVKVQSPGRVWRYYARSRDADTSVTSWVLLACVSARSAGLDVPDQVFVGAEQWFDVAGEHLPINEFEVFVPDHFGKDRDSAYFVDVSYGSRGKIREFKLKTSYQPPRWYTPAMSAIGLLARIWLGWTRAHPFCIGSANQVMTEIPGYDHGLEHAVESFYPYSWFYGSLAMYQMGGRYWVRWRENCIKDVVAHQRRSGFQRGSWEMPRSDDGDGGTICCTALAILTLETFYRYQPYLERHDRRSDDGGSGK